MTSHSTLNVSFHGLPVGNLTLNESGKLCMFPAIG